MAKKTSLCFVCTGNTCRSPMAQFILKNLISKYEALDIKITSFGVNVTETEMSLFAKNLLKSKKIKMTKFTPKQISLDKVKGYDAIVAVTDDIMAYLKVNGYQNVYSVNQLTKLGDVIDPYGGNYDDYLSCFNHLEKSCEIIFDMLKQVI